MSQNEYLFNHIDLWETEGLISHEQAENMKQHAPSCTVAQLSCSSSSPKSP